MLETGKGGKYVMAMNINKKIRIAAALLLMCLSLGGCTNISFKNLMAPPKANADQQAIYNLLKDDNGDVSYFYPKSGDYRSAIIMHDFTGDGTDDAVGFCGSTERGEIYIKFMSESDGEWEILDSLGSTASQVDRVTFGDITGDGVDEIIVGWGAPQSMTSSISVYSVKGGRVTEFPIPELYNEFILADLNGDGAMEIFTAGVRPQTDEAGLAPSDSAGKIYQYVNGGISSSYSTPLNANVVRYTKISLSLLPGGETAIILDGTLADNSMTTQILSMNGKNNVLSSLISSDSLVEKFNFFYRPSSLPVTSMDIGTDGYVELPYVTVTAGYSDNPSNPSCAYLVDWVRFDPRTGRSVSVLPTIMNIPEYYYVGLPPALKNKILCTNSDAARELTFYKIDTIGELVSSQKLFTIKTLTRSEWREMEESTNYELLKSSQGDLVYAVNIHDNSQITKFMLNNFKIIGE